MWKVNGHIGEGSGFGGGKYSQSRSGGRKCAVKKLTGLQVLATRNGRTLAAGRKGARRGSGSGVGQRGTHGSRARAGTDGAEEEAPLEYLSNHNDSDISGRLAKTQTNGAQLPPAF
jgi:hypothetical protein